MAEGSKDKSKQDEVVPESPQESTVEELLLSKLREHSGRAMPHRISRVALTPEFLARVPGLSFVWVYDRQSGSEVPQYLNMGYAVFQIPDGLEPHEICPAAVRDGSKLRLDDCILMYATKERVQEIMDSIQRHMKSMSIEQSELIQTGTGADERPAGKETMFDMIPGVPVSQEGVDSLMKKQ